MDRRHRVLAFLCVFGLASHFLAGQQADPSRDRSAAIVGRVTDAQSAPLAADVMIYGRAVMDGRVDLFAMCSIPTDADGKYVCRSMRPGKYLVSATVKRLATKTGQPSVNVVYPRTFSPGATTLAEASVIQLTSGATGLADITIQPEQPGKLVGHLATRPTSPTFTVKSHSDSLELPTEAHTDYDPSTGAFTLSELPQGTYSVNVDWWSSERMHHDYGVAKVGPEKEQIVALSETGSHSVSGSLHVAEDDRRQTPLPASIELIGLGDHVGWQLDASVSSDGSFAFPEIADGDYVLRTRTGSSVFVDSISSSGRAGSTDVLHLRSGEKATGLDVVLRSTDATVAGTLEPNGFSPEKSGLVLQSESDQSLLIVSPDRDGAFTARNVPPGDYRVFAWSDLKDAEYRNPAELARLKKNSKEIHVDNDSHLTGVELELILSSS